MDDLITWLRAQIDRQERIALKASPGPWKANAEHDEVIAVDDVVLADGFALNEPQFRRPSRRWRQPSTVCCCGAWCWTAR